MSTTSNTTMKVMSKAHSNNFIETNTLENKALIFLRPQFFLELTLNFGSISKKSLAHPHVARNVMLKFQKKLTSSFCAHKKT